MFLETGRKIRGSFRLIISTYCRVLCCSHLAFGLCVSSWLLRTSDSESSGMDFWPEGQEFVSTMII